jgi:hypothetical protein
MKCPKCSFVSHDYLDACRKCSIDLVNFKAQMHLVAIRPGVLDLSRALEASHSHVAQVPFVRAHDDFIGSQMLVESEESDDTFDISLDDDFGMTPTQIEELRTMRPGGDDEATEILSAAMAAPGVQDLQRQVDPHAAEQTPSGDLPPAPGDPLGPPKTGYATVMIDLNDMEEITGRPGDVVPQENAVAASETPDVPELEFPSLEGEELTLSMSEAEDPIVAEVTAAAPSLDEMDETALAVGSTIEATEETLGLDEADRVTFDAEEPTAIEATEMTAGLGEADEMTFDAEDLLATEATEAASGLDEADEMTIIDEMVDVTSAEASEPTLALGSLEAEDELGLAELTEMSLEVQDVEEMEEYQATELETALEMPSIDLDAALTAEEPMTAELDDEPVVQARSFEASLAAMDEDEEELRLEFDDLDLEDDEKSSS